MDFTQVTKDPNRLVTVIVPHWSIVVQDSDNDIEIEEGGSLVSTTGLSPEYYPEYEDDIDD